MSSVNKSKFILAAKRLHESSLGNLVPLNSVSNLCIVFVKKPPEQIGDLLAMEGNRDLCTYDEFEYRFYMPTPAVISMKIQGSLVSMGMVLPEHFKKKEKRNKTQSSATQDQIPKMEFIQSNQ